MISLIPKSLIRVKNKIAIKIFNRLYRRMGNYYTEGFPELTDSVFSSIYPALLTHNIEIVDYDKTENYIYLKKENLHFVTTPDYPWIVREVFCQHIYFIRPEFLKHEDYTIFDIGMNRAYASLYFANQPWCKEVYGFELSEKTFQIAEKNLKLNVGLKNKIRAFNFGLGNKDQTLKTYYLPHRDGICTTSKEFLESYAPEELQRITETESLVKKTSSVLKEIVENNCIKNIILKIDAEGAEYEIFNDIIADYPGFLEKVDIIIGDAHLGLDPLTNGLKPFGFKQVSVKDFNPKTSDFLFVKN